MIRYSLLLVTTAATALAVGAAPAHAQQAAAQASGQSARAGSTQDNGAQNSDAAGFDAVHGTMQPELVVSAPYVRDLDVLAGSSVLQGGDLIRDIRGQVGDTLLAMPGVSATSFSPGASRPVLRGFQGERVRVLTDGLGSLDASNTSADHGVTIDPLTAERIEVLHGPAVLLYGSQAIGGAVNVLDRRIPRAVPGQGYHVDMMGTYGSAANERSAGGAFDLAVTPTIVVHADGSYRKTDNLETGGYILSSGLRAEQSAIAAEELSEGHDEAAAEAEELANARGTLANSATKTWTAGAGVSLINDGGSLGFSVGWYNSDYGVPERPAGGHDHGGEEAPVTIGMHQFRADMRGEVDVNGGFLDSIRVRAGYADYTHTEYEGSEVGTTFYSDAFEGRLELVQADRNGWRGVIGAQGYTRDFDAVGEEAFVPANVTDQYGIFTLQEVDLGLFGLEFAGRYEHTNVSSQAVIMGIGAGAPVEAVDRSFDAVSFAAGATYEIAPDVKIGISGSHAERAPSAEELFSNGLHVATQAYELGNPDLTTEKSWGIEIFAHGHTGPVHFKLSGYAQWFHDYVYEAGTGIEVEEMPLYQYLQANARYIGFEADVTATLYQAQDWTVSANVVADAVRADLTDMDQPVPRIPPFRVLGGLNVEHGIWGGRVEVEHVTKQDRVSDFETPTNAFTLVNLSASVRPFGADNETTLILSADNLFDVEARRHASFTKDFVPLAGRDIRVAVRFSF